jgi:selT/selW/selH-like putative selenoprotein
LAARIKSAKGGQQGQSLEIELVKGARGSFEILKDGKLLFSKLATGQFPDSEDAIVKLL